MHGNKGTKAEFARSLDWPDDFISEWVGDTGIVRIDDDRRARIDLSTYGQGGHYVGAYVMIINKREGEVDKRFFRFDDFLLGAVKRTDGREDDYPIGSNPTYQAIDHVGWHWYIAVPETSAPWCEALQQYVEVYR